MDFKDKELQELIETLLHYESKPPAIVVPDWWVERESAEHPEYFRFNADGTMTWCGYIVYTYGDRIKYENSN